MWQRTIGSLWFLPGVVVLACVAAALAMIELSRAFDAVAVERALLERPQ